MALELYCDGAVIDTTPHTAHGTCKSCDATTDRQTRPAGETVWAFECENCDPAEH
jgi:DNA replicative helicase MCM subunit Mcm2 (Cdc46/Mcm family)